MAEIIKDKIICRQNQTQQCREYLKAMGYLELLTPYEFAVYVELMSDMCYLGLTDDVKKRLQTFTNIINERNKTK